MKKYISFLAIAALFVACQPNNELGTPFQAGQEVTLSAYMPNAGNNGAQQLPGKQRVSGLDTGTQINLTWDAGDVILVKVGDKTAEFTLESGAGEAQATFKGVMPTDGTSYSVQYPIAEPDLSSQTYVKDGFGKGLMKMVTETNGTIDGGFTLKAQNALLGLQLTGSDALGKIVLTNPADSKTYTLNCSGVTLSATATLFYIVVPAGEWGSGFNVSVKDSEGNEITSFTKADAVTLSATTAMIMPIKEVESVKNYEGIGVFSVSADKQVTFSPGNLQYTQSTNTWSLAENQWDMIGTDNVTGGSVYSDPTHGDGKSGDALADKIDLFGWSTGATNFGVSTSTDYNDYLGSFVDWGTNQIGADAPNTWRTLSEDEWDYLLDTRTNASSLCGVALVNGVNGLVFLPDSWTCPEGVTFKSGFSSEWSVEGYGQYQTFTAEQWSVLESAGAVFLPASGYRDGSAVYDVQAHGRYWSATEGLFNNDARYLYFGSGGAYWDYDNRHRGLFVRLVKDISGGTTPNTPTEPENTENGHEYVDLGLSVKWATCNVGATKPEEYGDYFAWGETQPKSYYDWSNYKWCNGSDDTQTKYCTNSSYGIVDHKTVLEAADDAATVNWGGSWRMPTKAEQNELRTECTWTWTTENGLNGYRIISNKAGYTDKSIFLPAAGARYCSDLLNAGSYGFYWSSSLRTDYPYNAEGWCFLSDYKDLIYDSRNYGRSVRPVCQQNQQLCCLRTKE